MSKESITRILFSILILLAGFWGVQEYLQRVETEITKEEENIFQEINTDSISQLIIQKNKEQDTLYKQDEQWFLQGEEDVKVDQDAVNEILEGMQDSRIVSIASENQDKRELFETTPEKGIILKITHDEKETEVILGKTGSEYQSVYITMSEVDKILLIKTNLRTLLLQEGYKEESTEE